MSVATAIKYNDSDCLLLLKYDDGQERWHKVDFKKDSIDTSVISRNFESTFDDKTLYFKIISLPKDSQTNIVESMDHSHHDKHFPTIPPPLSESRLPQLFCKDPVSLNLYCLDFIARIKF